MLSIWLIAASGPKQQQGSDPTRDQENRNPRSQPPITRSISRSRTEAKVATRLSVYLESQRPLVDLSRSPHYRLSCPLCLITASCQRIISQDLSWQQELARSVLLRQSRLDCILPVWCRSACLPRGQREGRHRRRRWRRGMPPAPLRALLLRG